MKRIVLFICSFVVASLLNAQNVIDNFNVGPYEVDYIGKGDVNYRLKKDVDLYQFYGLKKDTIFISANNKNEIVKNATELGLFYALPRFGVKGAYNTFGIQGLFKRNLSNGLFFDFGLKAAISYGHYNSLYNYLKDVVFEIGIPVELEFVKLVKNQSSIFFGIGVVPSFFSTISCKDNAGNEIKKKNGIYFSPRLDFGGYIPVGHSFMKIGVFGEYKICCSKEEDNIFKERIGRTFIGANIGWIL